ncbi:MAG TPA: bifunctional helix-turn-helix transcriptional regulator/GNAT family N-acetyltransferase [Bradyrhizobium sp.]|uniref:bifunctional helix-turn-helix transcriptional regulator/GNAT family N-acetyltransferase n=1 Tax=Bradyrhizobium sp. TaxID=376 RepID=UPI002B4A9D67|nr:bifunctional helix-turn-helix transcriptional regulator/GNAT family N-acetyltransferase [Bradyrhizobium sp.]HKO72440.1 bifunctional helix-turn-helix transcriptional regulator/GNAT family N-acetyltransferase [Bradyrhizobium sp.]
MPKATILAYSPEMRKADLPDQLRSFGRSYTKKFGLLNRNPYHQDLTLLQSRIVFEVRERGDVLPSVLAQTLQLDKGYVSRSLAQLINSKVIQARENPRDKREKFLRLTSKGKQLFAKIDLASRTRSAEFLQALKPAAREELVKHLVSAELLMGEAPLRSEEVVLRAVAPGDLGWVIGRHGEVYFDEYGWNIDFEKLVGEIVVSFATRNDPARERAWIAEARGLRLGCVFLVRENEEIAKLRILLVDPIARGLGLGSRLVDECIRFARRAKYRKLTLWTNDILHAARKLYVAAGFQLTREERHRSFGHDLVGQFWKLDL